MRAVVTSNEFSASLPNCVDTGNYQQERIIPNYYAFRHDSKVHEMLLQFAALDAEFFPSERVHQLQHGNLFAVEEVAKLNRDVSRYVERSIPHNESFDTQCQTLENLGFSSTDAIETLRVVRTPYFQRTDGNWARLYEAANLLMSRVSTEKIAV